LTSPLLEGIRHLGPQFGVDHDESRLDLVEEVADDVRGEIRVEGCDHDSDLRRTELERVALDAVLANHQHPVAAPETGGLEPVTDLVHQPVELSEGEPVEGRVGDRARGGDQRLLLRGAPRQPLDEVRDAHPVPALICTPVEQADDVE